MTKRNIRLFSKSTAEAVLSVSKNAKKHIGLIQTNSDLVGSLKDTVIASQCAHWRGNPPDFQTFIVKNTIDTGKIGDCHTSDIGHWFAMTG